MTHLCLFLCLHVGPVATYIKTISRYDQDKDHQDLNGKGSSQSREMSKKTNELTCFFSLKPQIETTGNDHMQKKHALCPVGDRKLFRTSKSRIWIPSTLS